MWISLVRQLRAGARAPYEAPARGGGLAQGRTGRSDADLHRPRDIKNDPASSPVSGLGFRLRTRGSASLPYRIHSQLQGD